MDPIPPPHTLSDPGSNQDQDPRQFWANLIFPVLDTKKSNSSPDPPCFGIELDRPQRPIVNLGPQKTVCPVLWTPLDKIGGENTPSVHPPIPQDTPRIGRNSLGEPARKRVFALFRPGISTPRNSRRHTSSGGVPSTPPPTRMADPTHHRASRELFSCSEGPIGIIRSGFSLRSAGFLTKYGKLHI